MEGVRIGEGRGKCGDVDTGELSSNEEGEGDTELVGEGGDL